MEFTLNNRIIWDKILNMVQEYDRDDRNLHNFSKVIKIRGIKK
jgi:hypothetical protein